MEKVDFTQDLDRYFDGILGAIRSGYATAVEADSEEAKIVEALQYERVNIVFNDDMDETTARRSAAHLAAIGLRTERHDLRAINPDVAEKIDRMIHQALKLAEHTIGMGGDPTVTMLKAMQTDYAKKRNSVGGKLGTKTRIKWQDEARLRYDRYIANHPKITQATRIADGILKEGPIRASPSEGRVTGRSLDPKTMRDREAINRFCAFQLLGWQDYTSGDMDAFLAKALGRMNAEPNLDDLTAAFQTGLKRNEEIFGRHAFRKSLIEVEEWANRSVLNISLFEVLMVGLVRFSDEEFDSGADEIEAAIINLMSNYNFLQAVTYSTNSTRQVHERFSAIELAMNECIL